MDLSTGGRQLDEGAHGDPINAPSVPNRHVPGNIARSRGCRPRSRARRDDFLHIIEKHWPAGVDFTRHPCPAAGSRAGRCEGAPSTGNVGRRRGGILASGCSYQPTARTRCSTRFRYINRDLSRYDCRFRWVIRCVRLPARCLLMRQFAELKNPRPAHAPRLGSTTSR